MIAPAMIRVLARTTDIQFRDGAAQSDQDERRRLKDKINHPKARARETVPALPPQYYYKPYADNVRDHIAEDDGPHVQKVHFCTSVTEKNRTDASQCNY